MNIQIHKELLEVSKKHANFITERKGAMDLERNFTKVKICSAGEGVRKRALTHYWYYYKL